MPVRKSVRPSAWQGPRYEKKKRSPFAAIDLSEMPLEELQQLIKDRQLEELVPQFRDAMAKVKELRGKIIGLGGGKFICASRRVTNAHAVPDHLMRIMSERKAWSAEELAEMLIDDGYKPATLQKKAFVSYVVFVLSSTLRPFRRRMPNPHGQASRYVLIPGAKRKYEEMRERERLDATSIKDWREQQRVRKPKTRRRTKKRSRLPRTGVLRFHGDGGETKVVRTDGGNEPGAKRAMSS